MRYLQRSMAMGAFTTLAVCQAAAQVPTPGAPPPGSPLPGILQPQLPKVAPGLVTPSRPAVPELAAQGQSFAITEVTVLGASAFSPEVIAGYTSRLTGPAVFQGDIEAARQALIDLYRSQGYVYTTARATIDRHTLRFQIVEGYVGDIAIEGDIGPVEAQLRRFLNHIVDQKPLKAATLERWLLLAQDIPGLSLRSTLNPSSTDLGVLTLLVQASRKPISGSISADNRAFSSSGPYESLAVLNFDSFSAYGERTQASLFSTFNGTSLFGQASEELYLGGSGLKLRLYAGAGASMPTGTLGTIGYNGITRVAGAQLSFPILRTRPQSLTVALSFDALESDIGVNLGPGGTVLRNSYNSLRVLRFSGDYVRLDSLLGPTRSATNAVTLRVSQGLEFLGSSKNGDTAAPPPRYGQVVTFTKLSGELSRTQTLYEPFENGVISLHGAVSGQVTDDLLPPEEKFYLGGPRFNRGYFYGQVSGDKALTASAELRLNTPISMPKSVPMEARAQFYVFYDWGQVWQNTALESGASLRSAGGGVRFYLGEQIEVDLEGVYRGALYPTGSSLSVSALPSTAFYWQAMYRF